MTPTLLYSFHRKNTLNYYNVLQNIVQIHQIQESNGADRLFSFKEEGNSASAAEFTSWSQKARTKLRLLRSSSLSLFITVCLKMENIL